MPSRIAGVVLAIGFAALAVSHFAAGRTRQAELVAGFGDLSDPSARLDARRAIANHPLAADALGLLAFAQGDLDTARLAAAIDRRSVPANAYLFGHGLATRDYALAATAADRIMRVAPRTEPSLVFAHRLEESRKGQAALFAKLARAPAWGVPWLTSEGGHPLVRTVRARRLAAAPTALGCVTVEPLTRALLVQHDRRTAQALWNGHCDAGRPPAIADPGFTGRDAPFGWQRVADPRIAVDRLAGGVRIRSEAGIARPALSQPIDLPPGRYAIRFAGEGVEHVAARIACSGQVRPPGEDDDTKIAVPDCEGQRLIVMLAPRGEAVLRDIEIEPL